MKKILSISDATSLAFHTMGILASSPHTLFSTKHLARLLNASEHHLSKVLQRLAKAGFIKSVRGPAGGFLIIPSWERITLMEIYELMEGPFKPSECLLRTSICLWNNCILGDLLKDVNKQIMDYLGQTKLSDMIHSFNKTIPQIKEREGSL